MAANGLDHDTLRAIAERFPPYRVEGKGYRCRCPVHDDHDPSLDITMGSKGVPIVNCRAGCDQGQVWAAVRPPRQPKPGAGRRVTATYDYTDEHGVVLYQAVRFDPKDFRQRQPDGAGGWRWNMAGVRYVPYHLPAVIASDEVLVVEGEKDADNLAKLGLAATTNVGGAEGQNGKSKWRPEYAQALKGKHVLILPDNDPAGRRHARVVAASLAGLALSVRVLELPGLPEKGDVSDWLARGGTLEQLKALARDAPAREDWTPKQDESEPSRVTRPRDAPAREDWTAGLIEDGKKWARVEANVVKALREAPELRDRVRYSELAEAVQYRGMPWESDGKWRTWEDVDDTRLAVWLQEKLLFVKHTTCARAVTAVANESRHNPVRDYLAGLRWDGTPRLTDWLITYVGASPGKVDEKSTGEAKEKAEEAVARRLAYIQAVGRKWLISLVARTFRPGCQADHMLVLEGPQGARKTSLLRAVLPESDWFLAAKSTFGTKDSLQDLRGKTLVEFGELAAMGRGQIREIKDFITCTIDTYRPSFGARPRDFKRRCVCAGSTNELTYLLDDTGNRRFWCVRVGVILLEAFVEDRDQILAEAVAAFHGGEEWHLDVTLEGTAAEEQEERRVVLPWEELIANWLAHPEQSANSFTSNQILEGAVRMHPADRDRAAQTQVGHVMRLLGWESYRPHGGDRIRRYRRPTPVQPG